MAKIYLNRLKSRYGWRGRKYEELMKQIITQNSKNIASDVSRITADVFKKERAKIRGTEKEKRFVLPDTKEIIPRSQVFIRKGAEVGKPLTDNLRDRLTKRLKTVLKDPKYTYSRGRMAGELKQQAIDDFARNIKKTFENYTKKDPSIGVPKNIHAIAVTEVRSMIDETKHDYMERFQELNPDILISKTWKHTTKGEYIRKHHKALNNKTIPFNAKFELRGNRLYYARYPHDPVLPAEEVVTCGCLVIYKMQKPRRKK